MHPIGILILAVLLWFVGFGTRRHAAIAMVAGILYLTEGQTFDVGINFFAIRILGIALFTRVMLRREFAFSKLHKVDRMFLILYIYTAVIFLLRSKSDSLSTVAVCIDACFCYFGFRGLIRSREDLRWLLRAVFFLLVPYALLVLKERLTGLSVFVFMGGPAGGWERGGVPRCMGAFRYPVSLGTFAATFLAMYVGLFKSPRDRPLAAMAIGICGWLIFASNSGGSITAAGATLVAWMLWYFRKEMRLFRWGIVVALILLALVMKAPVWYVLNRVSFGGDSWHRAYLIDVALRNFDKWWLFGMETKDTARWFPYTVNGAADITNQYLVFGLTAGVVAMAMFVVVLSRAFANLGMAMAKARASNAPASTNYMLWGLGVMLGVHVITWFGVAYFDQIYAAWFLQLACIVSVTEEIARAKPGSKDAVIIEPVPRVKRREPQMAWG